MTSVIKNISGHEIFRNGIMKRSNRNRNPAMIILKKEKTDNDQFKLIFDRDFDLEIADRFFRNSF
jgi:hypothetical protein